LRNEITESPDPIMIALSSETTCDARWLFKREDKWNV